MTSSERFEMIYLTIRQHGLRRMTRYLCELVQLSTSGYYRWLRSEEQRQIREHADERDFLLIKEHFDALRGKAGALVIEMRLEREPEKVRLTDITYLHYGNGQCAYLSCVKDGATKQIIAHYLSSSLELTIVERTMDRLLERLDGNVHPEAILHSDQGMHYTHPKFQRIVSQAGFTQSMSRKGNCWDNASMETFFGHMKDELDYRQCETVQELRIQVDEYIAYYNSARYQWALKKMTPNEFRSHLLAG